MHHTLFRYARSIAAPGLLAAAAATCNGADKTPTVQQPPPPGVAAVAKVAGDAQTGPVAVALPVPLAVKVTDSAGNGVQGITVAWAVVSGGGSVSATSGSTDASGQVTVGWTLGTALGANVATATVTGITPVSFAATATAGPAAKLAFTTQPPASVTAGSALSPAVQVAVRDAYGNATAAGNAVTVAITSGTGTGGATLSGTPSKAASAGAASFSDLSINRSGTGYTLTATATGLTSAVSSAFAVTAAAVASVAQQAGDSQSAATGAAVATPPAVLAKDAFGNVKPGASVTFAVASGGGSVTGAGQTTNASGVATVGGWTLGSAAGANTLTATVAGNGITGNPVTFTATATSGGGGGGGGGSATLLFAETFADANLASRGWYDTPTGTGVSTSAIDATQHAPGSTASLVANFSTGNSTPSPALAMRHKFTPSNSVYLRFWVKYSTNWVGSGQTYHPHEFDFFTTDDQDYVSPAANHLTVYVEHNWHSGSPAGGYAAVLTQDATNIDAANVNKNLVGVSENRAVSGCNGVADSTAWNTVVGLCYQNSGWNNEREMESTGPVFLPNAGTGYKNNWNLVEVYIQLNSIVGGIGQQDGVLQYWFDSTLVIDQHHLLFRTGAHPTMQFNQLFFGPYMDSPPLAEQAWYDDVVVMTARP